MSNPSFLRSFLNEFPSTLLPMKFPLYIGNKCSLFRVFIYFLLVFIYSLQFLRAVIIADERF